MTELQRITTEYIDSEDRIRLSGQDGDSDVVVIWLTQRLLVRLLPHLFKWLEQQDSGAIPSEIVQSFAQQAAQSELLPESPVVTAPGNEAWLAQSVDIAHDATVLKMQFRNTCQEGPTLSLPNQQLRQWLNIIHLLWQGAEWPDNLWPEWINENPPAPQEGTGVAVH